MKSLLVLLVTVACAALLSSCSIWPLSLLKSDDAQADARMEQIAEAVEAQDAGALKALFSSRSLERATDFDGGLDYFMSFFPNGDLTWDVDRVNSSVSSRPEGRTELLHAFLKVTAGGKDFWVVFTDFTENGAIDPENVGLYGLGVTPWSDNLRSRPIVGLFTWTDSIRKDDDGTYGYPGIYVPDDTIVYPAESMDLRMGEIADALDRRDEAALRALFSSRAFERADDFDEQITQFLAFLPEGSLSWDLQGGNAQGGDIDEVTTLFTAQYKVEVAGREYWLFFAEFLATPDADDLGLAALAVSPWTEPGDPDLDPEFGEWNSVWIQKSNGPYGLYAPAESAGARRESSFVRLGGDDGN